MNGNKISPVHTAQAGLTILTKACSRCGIEKAVSGEHFARDKCGKFGLRSVCKDCDKGYRSKHYQSNRESIRAKQNQYVKGYYQANKEEILAYKKQRYASKVKGAGSNG